MGPRERPALLFLTSTKAAAGVVTEGSARLPSLVCRAQVERKVDTKGGFLRTGGLGGSRGAPRLSSRICLGLVHTVCELCTSWIVWKPRLPLCAPGSRPPRAQDRAQGRGWRPSSSPALEKAFLCPASPARPILGNLFRRTSLSFSRLRMPVSVCKWRRSRPGTPRKLPPPGLCREGHGFHDSTWPAPRGESGCILPSG